MQRSSIWETTGLAKRVKKTQSLTHPRTRYWHTDLECKWERAIQSYWETFLGSGVSVGLPEMLCSIQLWKFLTPEPGRSSCFLSEPLWTQSAIWLLSHEPQNVWTAPLWLCFIIFPMPASSIPDTLLELSAAPGCQRKFQRFDRAAQLTLPTQPFQAPLLHPCQVTWDAPPPQRTLTSPQSPVLLLVAGHHHWFPDRQNDLAFASKVKKTPTNISHKTLSRNNQTEASERGQTQIKRHQKP